MKIEYVNALSGSGKTYGIAKWANSRAIAGHKVLLVQPTAILIGQTLGTTFPLCGVTCPVTEITARTHPNKVIAGIIEHMRTTPPALGEILVITHAAFVLLSQQYVHGRENWIVVVDEVLEIQSSYTMNLPNTHEIITTSIEVSDATDTEYWTISKKAGSTKLEEIAKNELRDDVYGCYFQEFASRLLSPDWQVFVRADRYMTMLAEVDVPGVERQLNASAVLHPSIFSGFRRVIMMSACFTESLIYMIWSRLQNIDVDFVDITDQFELRYLEHVNGDTLDIHYALDGNWSKNVRGRTATTVDGDEVEIFAGIRAAAQGLIGEQPTAYLYNNDIVDEMDASSERLPAYSHGLNTYQHLDNAVLLIAINPQPAHFGFLRKFVDIDPEDIRTAMYRSCVYQAAMRISLRDPTNRNPKTLVVPDRATAEWLSDLFKGSRVHRIDLFADGSRVGRAPRMYESNAEKQKAYRERLAYTRPIKLDRELRVRLVNGYPISNKYALRGDELSASMTETSNLVGMTLDRTKFHGSFHPENVRLAQPYSHFVDSFDDLVNAFREASNEYLEQKTDCLLWSPSHFVPREGEQTVRGYANIAFCRHVVLDNDGGDLTPGQFASFFPGLRMLIYSTWSSSRAVPKWRALIPTDHLVDIEGYKLLAQRIIQVVRDRGYHGAADFVKEPSLAKGANGTHGFDVSKLNPSNLLFLPSKGANPEDAYFHDMSGGVRGPLPVFEWLEAIPVPVEPPAPVPAPPVATINPKATASLQRLQQAILASNAIRVKCGVVERTGEALEWWRTHGDVSGGRDAGFMRLALKLQFAGCDEAQFKDAMRDAAMASRGDGKELRAKINRMWRKMSR